MSVKPSEGLVECPVCRREEIIEHMVERRICSWCELDGIEAIDQGMQALCLAKRSDSQVSYDQRVVGNYHLFKIEGNYPKEKALSVSGR